MLRNSPFWYMASVAAILAVLISVFGTSSALAARDGTSPTKPASITIVSQ